MTEGNIVDQLTVVIDTDGHTQRNYLYPKDPRRKGKWGDTVVVDPLRVNILVNEKVPWRSTAVRVYVDMRLVLPTRWQHSGVRAGIQCWALTEHGTHWPYS